MRLTAIVYNPAAGGGNNLKQDIQKVFGTSASDLIFLDIKQGPEAHATEIKRKKVKAVVAAGGDGTVNAVANLATNLQLPMGVLPIGTLNHFAKDTGIPLKLDEAASVIQNGNIELIDYCTVNGHAFINNSSIGLYPSTVRQRDKLEPKTGKWLGATIASIRALFKLSTTHLGFEFANRKLVFKTPLAFIGNGSYRHEEVGFTNRQSLTGGKLFLYVIRSNRITGIIQLTVLAFFGKRPKNKDYLTTIDDKLTINSRKYDIDVAVDGEVISLKPPLEYIMHPKALHLFILKK